MDQPLTHGEMLAARIAALKATVPITEETLAIVDGIPSNATQTNSVFEIADMAEDWSEIASLMPVRTPSATIGRSRRQSAQ